jgi:hypothetical protein
MVPRSPTALRLLTQAARVLIEKGIDRSYLQCQRAKETRNAQPSLFDADQPNLPRVGEAKIAAYELRVPPRLVAQVKAIIEDEAKRLTEDTRGPCRGYIWTSTCTSRSCLRRLRPTRTQRS